MWCYFLFDLFLLFVFFFFFSSRRRHTRLQGDWSSDVCSSDLFCFLCRRARHIHMDDLPRLQLNDKESKKRTKEKIGHLQGIASPYLCRMVADRKSVV